MIQDNKNLTHETRKDKKLLINQRFIEAIEKMVELKVEKNQTRLDQKIGFDYKNRGRYKSGQAFIQNDVIYNAVNELGLNANYLFMQDGPDKESLLLEGSVLNVAGNVGDNNTLIAHEQSANKPTIHVGNLNVVHTLERLISDMPPEIQEKLLTHFNYMGKEMETLKKTADRHEKELIEKKDELVEAKRALVESKGLVKKKDAQLIEKDVLLTETNDQLIKTKDELIGLQKKIYELQSQYVETVKETEKVILAMKKEQG